MYTSYDDEPEDIFLPLPQKLYSDLYKLEMSGFTDDIKFYKTIIPTKGKLLELGCGTGRITQALASEYKRTVGIDLSMPMLKNAIIANKRNCNYLCMDMRRLSFSISFETIIIPYNTLNLLSEKESIISCLKGCKSLLTEKGEIHLQLFIPDKKTIEHQGKTFQFQMFDRQGGGKIIKEILKEYSAKPKTINIEERYRIRPMQTNCKNQDWHHFFTVAAFSSEEWFTLFKKSGLRVNNYWADYGKSPFIPGESCTMLVTLCP